jgi:hypothetical protein
MAKKIRINYSSIEKVRDEVIFSKQVEYNKQPLELTIKINPKKYKRINYSYQPLAAEIRGI